MVAAASSLCGNTAGAAEERGTVPGEFCTNTAKAVRTACDNETDADYWLAVGLCRNKAKPDSQQRCLDRAQEARREARQLCVDQFAARKDVCTEVGEASYSPRIDPANFVDRINNRYLPLKPGTTFIYRGKTDEGIERITVEVTDQTTIILGVKCTVVRDTVRLDGVLVEDTLDWFAQDKQGNVWYFGEISKEFEDGELTSLEGSWKAGVDGALPGIVMRASPKVGDVYRQEFLLGEAEDLARVVSLAADADVPGASCKNCLETAEFTPIEPDVDEHKFYAPGVGLILEVNQETGERIELIRVERR
jgi:hypothetical protein